MNKEEFIKSKDFMKLGHAVEHGTWQSAIMIVQRMQRDAKAAQVTDFDRHLVNMKMCISSRQKNEALNILTLMVQRRVSMLKALQTENVKEAKNQE